MAILVIFWGFFGLKMAKITSIGLKIGLPIDCDLNDGQNKNQTHISEIMAKIPNIWPKIGQLPLWRMDFQWA